MRQIFSSGSLGETCALARATAAAAAARAAAASASGFCANAADPKRLAATRQLAVSIQIFLISILPWSVPSPLGFLHCGQSSALVPATEILPDHSSAARYNARDISRLMRTDGLYDQPPRSRYRRADYAWRCHR